jgi:hypothetical protein
MHTYIFSRRKHKRSKLENLFRKTNLVAFRPENLRSLDLRKTNAKPLELGRRRKSDRSDTSYIDIEIYQEKQRTL